MHLDFPGVTATLDDAALVLCSQQPFQILSSAVVGGGVMHGRYIVNYHVRKGYCHPQPADDLTAFAQSRGITEPFVGLMTAALMQQTRVSTLRDSELTVSVVATAGLSNPAAPGLSPPAVATPGTINLIVLIDAQLLPAAQVNAVITATEAKSHILLEREARTPEGHLATGTSTDAVVVACTDRGEPLPYAGPVTRVGWLIGRCVRQVLQQALA